MPIEFEIFSIVVGPVSDATPPDETTDLTTSGSESQDSPVADPAVVDTVVKEASNGTN